MPARREGRGRRPRMLGLLAAVLGLCVAGALGAVCAVAVAAGGSHAAHRHPAHRHHKARHRHHRRRHHRGPATTSTRPTSTTRPTASTPTATTGPAATTPTTTAPGSTTGTMTMPMPMPTTATTPPPTTTTTTTTPATLPHKTAVNETEYSIKPGYTKLAAGTITFNVYDDGQDAHDLAVLANDDGQGNGTILGQTAQLKPGGSAQLVVTLAPGTYTLECTLYGNHEHYDMGMHTTITVQ